MAKVFDLHGGLKDGGQANLNQEETDKVTKIQETQIEHDETNHGLKIEMRNKVSAHFMRVELPEEIINEIIEYKDADNQEFKDNLKFVLEKIGKTFLKKSYNLEKKFTDIKIKFKEHDFIDAYFNGPYQIQMLLFTQDKGETRFDWGNTTVLTDHVLRPKMEETVKHERGVLLVYPSYVMGTSKEIGLHMTVDLKY